MSVKLKICGIRRIEDVNYLNQYAPDYAGFILSKPFWRYVSPEQMQVLHENLNLNIKRVGVFVNPELEEILAYAKFLNVIQLHGEESENLIMNIKSQTGLEIWKAVRVQNAEDINKADNLPVDKLVLDSFSAISHGGTGTIANWNLIAENKPKKLFFLAGGISENNLTEAIHFVQPYGIDVSSSVETEKCKDLHKIRQIVQNIRRIKNAE
ncbi:MAG: phosphoribosylanthranilate isomerase [Oscillospiraceae bacterium]|nr:phosphoribosylanthranilate isomerase [Oscillospiraceae bacterium]